jgi:hypothetical protein
MNRDTKVMAIVDKTPLQEAWDGLSISLFRAYYRWPNKNFLLGWVSLEPASFLGQTGLIFIQDDDALTSMYHFPFIIKDVPTDQQEHLSR